MFSVTWYKMVSGSSVCFYGKIKPLPVEATHFTFHHTAFDKKVSYGFMYLYMESPLLRRFSEVIRKGIAQCTINAGLQKSFW